MYYLRLDASHPAAMQLIKFSLYPDCSLTLWLCFRHPLPGPEPES